MEVTGYFHGLEVIGTVTKDIDGSGQPLYEVDWLNVYSGDEISGFLNDRTIGEIQDFLIEIAIKEGL